jgi:hypothetical protein
MPVRKRVEFHASMAHGEGLACFVFQRFEGSIHDRGTRTHFLAEQVQVPLLPRIPDRVMEVKVTFGNQLSRVSSGLIDGPDLVMSAVAEEPLRSIRREGGVLWVALEQMGRSLEYRSSPELALGVLPRDRGEE